jgi:hypothetical protein
MFTFCDYLHISDLSCTHNVHIVTCRKFTTWVHPPIRVYVAIVDLIIMMSMIKNYIIYAFLLGVISPT